MSYARDPFDTDEAPCFCDLDDGPVLTTAEHCPAHGVDAEGDHIVHHVRDPKGDEAAHG